MTLRRRQPRRPIALLLGAVAIMIAWPARAYALDRRVEAAARKALTAAEGSYRAKEFDDGMIQLVRAIKACGSSRCDPATHAELLRDAGVMQFARNEKGKADILFHEALEDAPGLGWNAAYGDPAVVAEWAAVKDEIAALHETPPEGDLDHVPVAEQVVDTPLPVYAEFNATGIGKVVVKYRVPGETTFKRRTLPRFGGGFGGTIPCQDVKRGVMRYFIQAFDREGVPMGNSGDTKHLYAVPIRWVLTGDPPRLPGASPPQSCQGEPAPPEPETTVEEPLAAATPPGRYVHFWVGISASVDLAVVPSGNDVCRVTSAGIPLNTSFFCTNPDGSDFPNAVQNAALAAGNGGQVGGGLAQGDIRILGTLAYAPTSHILVGARIGYVDQSYPGQAAFRNGQGVSIPIHAELRGTYLFGETPLARAGVSPYTFIGAGYAKMDALQLTNVTLTGIVETRPVVAWTLGGPWFASVGGGVRYAFSPRVAFLAGLKATIGFGSSGVLPTFAPELELQYGF